MVHNQLQPPVNTTCVRSNNSDHSVNVIPSTEGVSDFFAQIDSLLLETVEELQALRPARNELVIKILSDQKFPTDLTPRHRVMDRRDRVRDTAPFGTLIAERPAPTQDERGGGRPKPHYNSHRVVCP